MGLRYVQAQGVVPEQVELQLLQGLLVREVEHLLEDVDSQHGLHRPIGPAIVGTVHGGEGLLIDQGKGLVSEDLGPTPLQATGLGGWHQQVRLKQAPLGVALSEHGSLPDPGAASQPFWSHYALLRQDWRGVFTNESKKTSRRTPTRLRPNELLF